MYMNLDSLSSFLGRFIIIIVMSENISNQVGWMYHENLDYSAGLSLQEELHAAVVSRFNDNTTGYLLLCQHNPVITVGRFGKQDNILLSCEDLEKKMIKIYRTDRGGDVTFHAPGQLVVYPIINLKGFKLGVKSYVRQLEETVIGVLKHFGIEGERIEGYPGVWLGKKKIASIGVHVKSHVTAHGFALNVNTDLSYFSFIVPCGIKNIQVTSIERVLGKEIPVQKVVSIVLEVFAKVFNAKIIHPCLSPEQQTKLR